MTWSFSIETGQVPIAEIHTINGKSLKKTAKKILYLNNSESDTHEEDLSGVELFRDFTLESNETVVPMYYDADSEKRFPNRIVAAAGTLQGKSYMVSVLAKSYAKKYPDNNIVLFSWVKNDDNYKSIKKLSKIRIDETILDDPIEVSELKNSFCIFDDIEHFSNKKIVKELQRLRDSVFNCGRHDNIAVASARQVLMDGFLTKNINNSSFITFLFCKGGSRYQAGNWLKTYMHFDKYMIGKILNLPSRWVMVNKHTPIFILYERGGFII